MKSNKNMGFPGGSVVKNPPTSAGDTSIPALGRSCSQQEKQQYEALHTPTREKASAQQWRPSK